MKPEQTIDTSTHLRGQSILTDWIEANGLHPDEIYMIDRETCDGNFLVCYRYEQPLRISEEGVLATGPSTVVVEKVPPPPEVLEELLA